MRLLCGCLLTLFLAPASPTRATETEVPRGASPGETTRLAVIGEACPTFSWSAVPAASGYELVVYRLGERDGESEPVLRKRFAGAIYSWTPALDQCLARGDRYAWSVRALGKMEPSEWSVPGLFEVSPGPTRAEFEQALQVVRDYLRSGDDLAGKKTSPVEPEADRLATEPEAGAPFQLLNTGALTVTGEVRTLDPSGQPRLWGTGRAGGGLYGFVGGFCSNNGIQFGLSRAMVDWASAAQACPAGSWVCTAAERGSQTCRTNRRASYSVSYMGCDGIIQFPSTDDHFGWLADNTGTHYPKAKSEGSGSAPTPEEACKGFAVWCCFD